MIVFFATLLLQLIVSYVILADFKEDWGTKDGLWEAL